MSMTFKGVCFILKKFICMMSVLMFVYMFSFSSFAITSVSSMGQKKTIEDGPWAGQSYYMARIGSGGSVVNTNIVMNGFRNGTAAGEGYYSISSPDYYWDYYLFSSLDGSFNNIAIMSYDPLAELYIVNANGDLFSNVIEDAYLGEFDGKYMYGVSLVNGVGIAFRTGSMTYITELSSAFNGGSYYDAFMDALPYVGGVYDSNSVAFRYPGMRYVDSVQPRNSTYGFWYQVFPLVADNSSRGNVTNGYSFMNSPGILSLDESYTFNYKLWNVPEFYVVNSENVIFDGSIVNDVGTCSFEASSTVLDQIIFRFGAGSVDDAGVYCFKYISSSSDDIGTIPPDDGGGSGSPDYSSALSSIDSNLKDLGSKLSAGTTTIVNNITNQTTQITNTITNTVTNMTQQITQGLSDVKQGITDKLQGVQQGITDKLGQVQDGINSKLEDVQNEIVNGYDNTGIVQENEKLEQSINDYDEVESEIFDEAGGFVGEFEYPSVDSLSGSVIKALAFVGSFLQSIFLSMGDFGSIITFSLTMIFVMVVVGYHRIRS